MILNWQRIANDHQERIHFAVYSGANGRVLRYVCRTERASLVSEEWNLWYLLVVIYRLVVNGFGCLGCEVLCFFALRSWFLLAGSCCCNSHSSVDMIHILAIYRCSSINYF